MRSSRAWLVVLVGCLSSVYARGAAAQPAGAGVPIDAREVVTVRVLDGSAGTRAGQGQGVLPVAAGPPSFGVPIEIREVRNQQPAPVVVLVNTGARDIHVFEVAVFRPGRDGAWEFVGSCGQGGITGWAPGEERRTTGSGWRPDDGSVLVPTMAVFDDGTAVGRPETIEAARATARGSRVALQAIHEAFEAFPDPVDATQLPLLTERVALAFARAPSSVDGRGSHHFFSAISELRRVSSPQRPAGLSVEEGVAQARARIEQALEVERRLPVLLKDPAVR